MELKTVFERYHATSDEFSPEEFDHKEESFASPAADDQAKDVDTQTPQRKVSISKRGWAFAILLALGALAAVFGLPENFKSLLHRNSEAQVVGVSEPSTAAALQNSPAAIPTGANTNQTPLSVPPAPVQASNDSTVSAANSNPQQPAVTQDASAGAAVASSETSSQPSVNEKQADMSTNATARTRAKTKAVASTVRRSSVLPYGSLHPGSVRARVLGTTPDGSLILGFPSGRTVVVAAPVTEFVPRYRVRYIPFERRAVFLPPPPFVPVFPPGY